MKQLFIIYGKPATGKTELVDGLTTNEMIHFYGYLEDVKINKEKGVAVIDNFCNSNANENINNIIELFNDGYKETIKFEGSNLYKIRKIILVGNRNLNEDEVIKIKNEVKDKVLFSIFEAKRYY